MVKWPREKLSCGVGLIDIQSRHRARWRNMLCRIYHPTMRQKAYEGCIVDPRWITLSNYHNWCEMVGVDGLQVDKDLLGDGKLYSPDVCCAVPQWLNSLFLTPNNKRSRLPTGVQRGSRNSFNVTVGIDGKPTYLGSYPTCEQAEEAYKEFRMTYIKSKYHLIRPLYRGEDIITACELRLTGGRGGGRGLEA